MIQEEVNRQYHEVANIFPLMRVDEFQALKDDIAEHGQREPIWLHTDGRIIDGRNRHRACSELGVEPECQVWDGKGSLIAFVVSLNLIRRHLDESQRAMVAAKLATMGQGERTDLSPIGERLSQSEAAGLLNVGKRSVERAHVVQEEGSEELISAVERGEVAVSTAADIATLPQEKQSELVARGKKEILEAAKQIRAEKTEVRRAERKERNNELCQNLPTLAGLPHKFDLIYADPPWRYEFSKTDSRVIENQYPTMALEDICAMPVGDIAIDNAVLFLWATMPKLEEALRVVNAWGFSYRTAIAWDKVRMGQGIYTRQQIELLLICIKGEMYSPELDFSKDFRSLVTIERSSKHSEKPCEFYDIIEGLYPDCTKIELFARDNRENWDSWGNQVDTFVDAE
jgi:N6-adenosine-specific RNA methylase IME4